LEVELERIGLDLDIGPTVLVTFVADLM